MKRLLLSTLALAGMMGSASTYAAGECGFTLEESNIEAISLEIASHALAGHKDDFKSPAERQPGKKIPWTLSEKNELAEFIADIIRKSATPSRDAAVKLSTVSKKLANERTAWWEDKTGTFVIFNPNEVDCGTAFRRDKGKGYYDAQT